MWGHRGSHQKNIGGSTAQCAFIVNVYSLGTQYQQWLVLSEHSFDS
jgi:hypothetical protein